MIFLVSFFVFLIKILRILVFSFLLLFFNVDNVLVFCLVGVVNVDFCRLIVNFFGLGVGLIVMVFRWLWVKLLILLIRLFVGVVCCLFWMDLNMMVSWLWYWCNRLNNIGVVVKFFMYKFLYRFFRWWFRLFIFFMLDICVFFFRVCRLCCRFVIIFRLFGVLI